MMDRTIRVEVAQILGELLARPKAREAFDRMKEIYWRMVYGHEKSRDRDEFEQLQARWPEFIAFLDVEA